MIASAPELLEALKESVQLWDGRDRSCYCMGDHVCTHCKAREAISKAEGGARCDRCRRPFSRLAPSAHWRLCEHCRPQGEVLAVREREGGGR